MTQFFSITTTRAALAEAVKLLASGKHKVIESRNTIPVISCVRLAVDPRDAGGFTVEGSDLDLAVSIHVNALETSAGAICLDAANLHKILGKATGETITISDAGGGMATIRDDGNGMTTRARTEKTDDFPIFKAREWSNTFEIDAGELLSDFENVGTAVSTEETRYYLNGIFMHADESSLKFVATDGHRLVRSVRGVPSGAETMPDSIIPRKAVGFMARAMKSKICANVESIAWQGCSTAFIAKIGRVTVKSKLIDGTFPDYARVIPAAGAQYMDNRLIIADAAVLAGNVESVTAHASGKVRAFRLSFGADFATLYCHDVENGNAGLSLSGFGAKTDKGEPFAIGANGGYFRQCLEIFGHRPVHLGFSDCAAPFMFESPAMPELTVVQMPYRLDGAEPITPEALARMNANPFDIFGDNLPNRIEALAVIESSDLSADVKKSTLLKKRRELGRAASEARAWLASSTGDPLGARLTIKRMIAEATGDLVTRGRVVAWQAWLAVPDSERVRGRIPGPVPGAGQVQVMPESAGHAVQVQAGHENAGQAIAAEALEAVPVVNVLISGNRRVHVLASDWESGADHLARVYPDGTPFCDPESKGGAWQTIARADVVRTIAPRGPYKESSAAPIPADVAAIIRELQERVAALETGEGEKVPETVEIAPCVEKIGLPVDISVKRPDVADIRGHEVAKRVLEIAAVGGLTVRLAGPSGIGKSMLIDAFGAFGDFKASEGERLTPGNHVSLDLVGVSPADITLPPPSEASATIAARVDAARARLADVMPGFQDAPEHERMIKAEALSDDIARRLMMQACEAMQLKPADVARVWATALVIACMSYRDEPLRVTRIHVAEALSYYRVAPKYRERTDAERRVLLRAAAMRAELKTLRAVADHGRASDRLDRMPAPVTADRIRVTFGAR